jgi:hypothetical protein
MDNENKFTLAKERHVASIMKSKTGWEPVKLGKYDHIDFRMDDGKKTVAFLEVRSRSHEFGRFDPLFIAEDKWMSLINAGLSFNVPVFFAFYFTDGIYFLDVMKFGKYETGYAKGRSNREVKRVTDYEKVVKVPVNRLKKIVINENLL